MNKNANYSHNLHGTFFSIHKAEINFALDSAIEQHDLHQQIIIFRRVDRKAIAKPPLE